MTMVTQVTTARMSNLFYVALERTGSSKRKTLQVTFSLIPKNHSTTKIMSHVTDRQSNLVQNVNTVFVEVW